jgi:hypothetical protein
LHGGFNAKNAKNAKGCRFMPFFAVFAFTRGPVFAAMRIGVTGAH